MALEDIFRALEEQADRDIVVVLAEAKEHAQSILEEAAVEAKLARENRIAQAEEAATQRSMQSLNAVRLEVRKRLAAAKERAVSHVFAEARDALGGIRNREDYPALFKAFVEEAVAGASEGFELLVDPADVDMAHRILSDIGIEASISADIQSSGGVVIAVDNRRIFRRNTLEDRLEKFEGAAQADVAEILFA